MNLEAFLTALKVLSAPRRQVASLLLVAKLFVTSSDALNNIIRRPPWRPVLVVVVVPRFHIVKRTVKVGPAVYQGQVKHG